MMNKQRGVGVKQRAFFIIFQIIFFSSLFFLPCAKAKMVDKLSLEDAILLAVRDNPNVQTSQLNYVAQKFNLWIQEWQFKPHYSLQASANFSDTKTSNIETGSHHYNVQPSISLLTPIGTQVTLSATNAKTIYYNPGLSAEIIQPLMRGFGRAVVEAALNNAKDSEVISKLNIEGTLRVTVTSVINAYLDVVSAEQSVIIDEEALKRAQISVEQTKLFIKAGSKAGNELVTVEADVASAQTELINAKNNLLQARFALLTAIGIDPNTEVSFSNLNVNQLLNKYHVPLTINESKKLILKNDIQYQTNQIMLHGSTSRALTVAVDNTRWQLNLTANMATGNGTVGGQNAGINSLFNGVNQARSVGFTLQVPIDDQLSKQAVVNAKIALKEAELALLQQKWSIETSAINGWNSVQSAKRALRYAEDAKELQEKTYHLSYQKYVHGLIDSLALQTAQIQLVRSQQTLLNARITYLKQLVKLDELTGSTLKTWNVKVRVHEILF